MGKIKIDSRYSVWHDAPLVRVIDDHNGAVVVCFRVPRDAGGGFADALKKAVDDIVSKDGDKPTQQTPKASAKKKKMKHVGKDEGAETETESPHEGGSE